MRRLARLAAVALAASALTPLTASPAHALQFRARIIVDTSNMSASAEVSDNLFNGRYTGVLTGTGEVSCSAFGPHTVLTATARGTGNPLYLSIGGTCRPYSGWVTYTLEWVGALGTSGTHSVHCLIAVGWVTCSPPGHDVELARLGL